MAGNPAAPRLDLSCHLNVLVADLSAPQFEAALDTLADAGYTRVVLPPVDPEAVDAAELGRVFAHRGLIPVPIAGQSPDADVSSPNPDVRAAGASALRTMVRFAADLGGDQLNGVPYGLFSHPTTVVDRSAFERSAVHVGSVADGARSEGVVVTFEVLNRYETALVNTAEQALDYLRCAGSDNLRVHLDTFHMAIEEADLVAAVVGAVPSLGYLELGQSARGRLGAGVVDVEGVVTAAWRAGYRGPIGVEAFSRGVIGPIAGDILSIWRSPFARGEALVQEAAEIIRRGVAAA